MRKALTGIAAFVIGSLLALALFNGHGSPSASHSAEWNEGYQAGVQMYQQADYMGSLPEKSPDDAQLVDYCDESAVGNEPDLPDLTEWLAGYSHGCYNG